MLTCAPVESAFLRHLRSSMDAEAHARTSTYPPNSPRDGGADETSSAPRHVDPARDGHVNSIPFQLVRRDDVLRVPRASKALTQSAESHADQDGDDEDAKLLLELHTASREASHAPALPSVPHPMAFPYPFPFGYPMPFAFTPMMYPTSTSPNATNPMMAFPQGMQAPPVPVPEGVAPVPYGNLVHPNDLRRIHHQPQENGKRARVSFSPHEIRVMEEVYKVESVPSLETRLELAQKLSIPPRRIQVWFQNKRARSKKPSDRATSSGRSSTVDAESDRLSKNSTDEAHSH